MSPSPEGPLGCKEKPWAPTPQTAAVWSRSTALIADWEEKVDENINENICGWIVGENCIKGLIFLKCF